MTIWLPVRTSIGVLSQDRRGITVVEFAMVAPVMCIMLLGGFDVAHTLYMDAALQGVVQKAARDSALETGSSQQQQQFIDDTVKENVKALANNADVQIKRRFYRTFTEAAAAKPEDWTDTNGDGICDAGEPYEDANLNNVWDKDGGDQGQGGARDATVYTVTVTYPRMFPIQKFIGGSDTTSVQAVTVLRNQPFGDQQSYGTAKIRNCP
ncbi:TadE/TadG family type IV pilus assembly protein [Stakelama marina]|uniref:Pilus assembly protein n=1 Tax=Stakelama marina TaxID=2826939 RepID=A0A8T4IGV5_9SPHN|nr:pilus assembly protein [Stakelama marina]MBR0551509.1 pilus assembly protein [Stakelama marina]